VIGINFVNSEVYASNISIKYDDEYDDNNNN